MPKKRDAVKTKCPDKSEERPDYGGRGNVSFSSNSPTYAKHMGSGIFKGLKSTKNYVTVTATASGDENYKSKTVTLKLRIN